jgi:hypothetical protein
MWEREIMNWRTSLKRWFGDKKESVDDVAHQLGRLIISLPSTQGSQHRALHEKNPGPG